MDKVVKSGSSADVTEMPEDKIVRSEAVMETGALKRGLKPRHL
jgi:hypothetical protein